MRVMMTRVFVTQRVSHPFCDFRHPRSEYQCPSVRSERARPLRDDDSTEASEALEYYAIVESRRGEHGVAERVRVGEVAGLDQRRQCRRNVSTGANDNDAVVVAKVLRFARGHRSHVDFRESHRRGAFAAQHSARDLDESLSPATRTKTFGMTSISNIRVGCAVIFLTKRLGQYTKALQTERCAMCIVYVGVRHATCSPIRDRVPTDFR